MIAGIGIDSVSISRINRLLEVRGERFMKKVFSEGEIKEGMKLEKKAAFFAARFAAREAFVKALGTGFRRGVSLHDVEVRKGTLGEPAFLFSKRMESMLESRGVNRWHLSLTHDGDSAQAIVILEHA